MMCIIIIIINTKVMRHNAKKHEIGVHLGFWRPFWIEDMVQSCFFHFYSIPHSWKHRCRNKNHHSRLSSEQVMTRNAKKTLKLAAILDFGGHFEFCIVHAWHSNQNCSTGPKLQFDTKNETFTWMWNKWGAGNIQIDLKKKGNFLTFVTWGR